ncbi:MAG: tetratricopeptide repeat protein, partial [Myxococcota bacterium]
RARAPDEPATHLIYGRIAWERGEFGTALGAMVEGFRRSWADPWELRMRVSNMAAGLSLAMLLAAFLFALASVYRHFRAIRYALIRPTGLSRLQAGILVFTLLLTPVLLGLGIVFVLLLWSVIAAAYYRPPERIAAGLVVAYLAAIPLLLPLCLGPLSYTGSRAHDAYLAATDIEAEAAAARLAAHPNPRPSEQFILGLRALWSGQIESASEWLSQAERAGEDSSEFLVSLGNVEYTRGNLDKAAKVYRSALDANPSNVMALFNLSRLRFSQTELAEAGELHRLASEADYALVQSWDEEQKRIGPTYVVKPKVPLQVLHQSHPGQAETSRAAADVWFVLGGGMDASVFAIAAGVGLAFILFTTALYRRGERKRGKTQPLERIRLEIEVHRHQARVERLRRVIAVVFAGAGQLIGRR